MSDVCESGRVRVLELDPGRMVRVAEHGARDGFPVAALPSPLRGSVEILTTGAKGPNTGRPHVGA